MQAVEEAFAEFLPPVGAEVAVPEEGKEELFLEDGLGRRGEADALFGGAGDELIRAGDMGEVEEFEEAIDGIAIDGRVER